MDPDELTVDPGGQVTTKVTVRNLGTRVEEFELVVQGPGASFASVIPSTVSIYPDVEQRAVVRFSPTRGPQSPAGVSTFEVVARSVVHADVRDVARGRLTVTAFEALQAVLKPDASRGRKPSRHVVSVTNGGNTPVNSQVEFADQGKVLTFDPRDKAVALQPGDTVDVPVLLNGAHRWFGRPEQLPFSAVVSPTGSQPPIMLNGMRQQTAVFARWVPPAAVVALGLLIAMAAFVIPWLTRSEVPRIGPVDQEIAVKQLTDAGFLADPIPQGHDSLAKGLAINTDPPGGTQLKKREHVKLFISGGPCVPGPCPVEVPNVAGLPVGEAQAKLEEKKFTVTVNQVPSETVPVDRVIDSDPKATTPRPPGTGVQLTVSTGPTQKPADTAAADQAAAEDKKAAAEKAAAEKKAAEDKAAAEKKAAEDKKAQEDKQKAEEEKKKTEEEEKKKTEQAGGGAGGAGTGSATLVPVPDLTASTVENATQKLTALKLKAKTETVHSNAVPDGQVLSTKPAKDSKVAPESEVTLTVAKNTTPVDLIAGAEDASWTTIASDGTTTKTLKFTDTTDAKPDSTGFVGSDKGKTPVVLKTSPPSGGGSITGIYTLEQPVVTGDHLRARIRLLPAEVDKVTFSVKAKGKSVSTEVRPVTINGITFQELDADLSAAKGATTVEITEQDTSTTPQPAQWYQFQLKPQIG